jgi:hypothetical protein
MIEKTVIILGAGASRDYGFPDGNTLIKNILIEEDHGFCAFGESKLADQHKIFDFENLTHLPDEILGDNQRDEIEKIIVDSRTQSIRLNHFKFFRNFISGLKLYRNSQIDYFLRTFSKYEKFGKIMIAREILKKEAVAIDKIRTGKFKSEDPNKNDGKDWIGSFFVNLIQKAKKPEDLKAISDNLTIVTFNYDLLFEHYLNEFCKGDDEWGSALEEFKKNLKIIHIYGKLGRFEWESEENLKEIYGEEVFKTFSLRGDNEYFGFLNKKYYYEKIRDLSEGIKVIGGKKHQEDLPHIKQARDAIYHTDCKKIFFFGFGFDKNNLVDCLRAHIDKFKSKNVYCTIYDENDEEGIKISVNDHIKNFKDLSDNNMKLFKLFEYGKFQTAQQISSLLLYI